MAEPNAEHISWPFPFLLSDDKVVRFALVRGLPMLVISLLTGIVSAVISLKFCDKASLLDDDDTPPSQHQNKEFVICDGDKRHSSETGHQSFAIEDALPFQSLGMSYTLALMVPLASVLRRVKPTLRRLSAAVRESHIACFLCIPTCIYFLIRLQLSRVVQVQAEHLLTYTQPFHVASVPI